MKSLAEIDRFYIVLGITLIILSVVFIYSFRGVFTSFTTAYEVRPPSQTGNKVDLVKFKQAEESLFAQEVPDFLSSENTPIQIPTPIVETSISPNPVTEVVSPVVVQ